MGHIFKCTIEPSRSKKILNWESAWELHKGILIAIHIAVSQTHKSQFLDKSRDAIANDARSCNCEYDYISETVQAVAKVTTEFEI